MAQAGHAIALGDVERQLSCRQTPGLLMKKHHFLLATKKQLTAQERGGIVKVVTEEITPFKRKGKKLGKQHNASGLVLHTISCKLQQRGGAGAGN